MSIEDQRIKLMSVLSKNVYGKHHNKGLGIFNLQNAIFFAGLSSKSLIKYIALFDERAGHLYHLVS